MKQRQADLYEFKIILVYKARSRTAGLHREILFSKKQTKPKTNKQTNKTKKKEKRKRKKVKESQAWWVAHDCSPRTWESEGGGLKPVYVI